MFVNTSKEVLEKLKSGEIDWEKDPIYCMLLNIKNVDDLPDKVHHIQDMEPFEMEAEGYTKGGQLLGKRQVERQFRETWYMAVDPIWHNCTFKVNGIAIYHKGTGGILGIVVLGKGEYQRNLNGNFKVTFDTGIVILGE